LSKNKGAKTKSTSLQKRRNKKPAESVYFQDASDSVLESQNLTEPAHSVIEAPNAHADEPLALKLPLEVEVESGDRNSNSSKSGDAKFSASERMVSGVGWSSISVVFNQFVFLLKSIALAHLLDREVFGLMAMSTTVHAAINAFTNFGLTNLIVSGKFKDDKEFESQLDTIWTIELIRRVGVTAVIMAMSYPIALFYKEPILAPILAITCVTLVAKGFENVGLKTLQRNVQWKQATLYGMTSTAFVSGLWWRSPSGVRT